jgi:L-threonylcarbamoyladenylate synthase
MKTQVIKINPLCPEREKVQAAATLIKNGEVVAFPTETVYGLGADAFNPSAVAKIFVAKNRPADNPLIIHISHQAQLPQLVTEIPKSAQKLIDWP